MIFFLLIYQWTNQSLLFEKSTFSGHSCKACDKVIKDKVAFCIAAREQQLVSSQLCCCLFNLLGEKSPSLFTCALFISLQFSNFYNLTAKALRRTKVDKKLIREQHPIPWLHSAHSSDIRSPIWPLDSCIVQVINESDLERNPAMLVRVVLRSRR